MNRKAFRRLTVLFAVLALFASIGAGFASRGESRHTTRQAVTLNHTNTENVALTCSSLKYPDGAYMVTMCGEPSSSPISGKWEHNNRLATNNPYPSGHSDTMRYCIYGFQHCTSYHGDGDVWGDTNDYTINNSDTMWVEFDVLYGSTWYCRRWYQNRFGDMSWSTCP